MNLALAYVSVRAMTDAKTELELNCRGASAEYILEAGRNFYPTIFHAPGDVPECQDH
jgi:hypothetical protein